MKKQFVLQLVLFATLFGMLFASCEKDAPEVLAVDLKVAKQSLEFKSEDAEQKVDVTSNFEWTATTEASWCKLKVEKTALVVSVDDYDNLENDRYTTITIKSSNGKDTKTVSIDVTQKKQEPASLILNPGEKAILECEGVVPTTVEIISTVGHIKWAWEGEMPEWMNEPTLEGNILTLTAQDNPTKEKRTATIIITVGKEGNQATQKLEVEQSPNAPYIKVMPSNVVKLDYLGTPQIIEVYWNTENYNFEEILEGPWGNRRYEAEEIVEKPAALRAELLKRRKKVYKIWATLNPKTEEWSQEISLYAQSDLGKPGLEQRIYHKFVIKQEAAPIASFSLTQKSVIFGSKGGEETLPVTASISNWTASTEADWLAVERKGEELFIKAKPNAQNETKRAVIKLVCGTENNRAEEQVNVVIAGVGSKIVLSEDIVMLDAEGNEKVVKVLSQSKDWFVEGAPAWLTVKEDTQKGTISLKATKAEGNREADLKVISTAGGSKIELALKVKQGKQYKIGELYTINGKVVGIVYSVYNNGTNGYVFSLEDSKLGAQNFDATKVPCWSVGMYAGDREDPDILKNMKPCCLDPNDGRNNLAAVKKRPAEDLRGMTWQERYPALAWVEKFDEERGNQGWYIPAKNELNTLVAYINGVYEGSGVYMPKDGSEEDSENQKKRAAALEKVNEVIKANGGDIFYRDLGHEGAVLSGMTELMSSTEADKNDSGIGYVAIYIIKPIYPWWVQWRHASAVSEREISDISHGTRVSIRPIMRF